VSSKAKNYLIGLLIVSTLCLSLIAWSQGRRLIALQGELEQALATPPKPAPVAAAFTATPVAKPGTPAAVEPAPVEAAPPAEARQRPRNRSNFAALMADPEFAKAMGLQQRAALDTRYADLFKQLNLSPAELEKFKDLLVERQTARMDVIAAARESGVNPRDNREEIRKLTQEAQAEVDANIKAALGETRFDQYQNYETTQPQRTVVAQLDQRLSYTSTPLNSTQSAFLVEALSATNNSSTDQTAGGPAPWNGGDRTTITDDVIQRAKSVLSPDQFAALKQLQLEQQAQQAVRSKLQR
jgi:predicted component of type VI protein secretion system